MKLLTYFLFAVAAIASGLSPAARADKPDILEIVEVGGAINGMTAEVIAKRVDEINDNAKVRAVLLVIDSPGGSVTASSAIYEDLARLKVPVVAWCQSVCASGGVYIMMSPAVKYIAVRSETITGSVGVILSVTRFNRLLDWAKIDNETYTSGSLKDAGNPTRAVSDPERQYLQGIVTSLADKFYGLVAKARPKIGPQGWAEVKTAKIFVGSEAVKLGLVDAVATRAEVVAKAKELSGSKTIFTREELKKMSYAADSGSTYEIPMKQPAMFGDVAWLIETAKEIRAGQSVKFEYRMPMEF